MSLSGVIDGARIQPVAREDSIRKLGAMEPITVREARRGDKEALARIDAEVARYYLKLAPDYFQVLERFGEQLASLNRAAGGRVIRRRARGAGRGPRGGRLQLDPRAAAMPATVAPGRALCDSALPAISDQGGLQRGVRFEHRGKAHRAVGAAEHFHDQGRPGDGALTFTGRG